MPEIRKIIHVDMDAFYAAVEQRDNPDFRGKPIIVGGSPNSRGVVATCSYEARKYGIHSAMPSSHAYRLCPHAIFVRARFKEYQAVSKQIRDVFHEYTDLVEPLSLDEAYLDVTVNKKGIPSATRIAQAIKKEIRDRTRLTASAGVSFNKFLAKVASDIDKPDGLTVITPEQADAFIADLPIETFFGVGKATAAKMHRLGVRSGADLREWTLKRLRKYFGKHGEYYFNIARGQDYRRVNPHRIRKSIGKETTFRDDLDNTGQMFDVFERLAGQVAEAMQRHGKAGRTVTMKVKYADFEQVTRGITMPYPVNTAVDLMKPVPRLLARTEAGRRKVRLLGLTVSNLQNTEDLDAAQVQLEFAFMRE